MKSSICNKCAGSGSLACEVCNQREDYFNLTYSNNMLDMEDEEEAE